MFIELCAYYFSLSFTFPLLLLLIHCSCINRQINRLVVARCIYMYIPVKRRRASRNMPVVIVVHSAKFSQNIVYCFMVTF